jgi:hypothetical protein
MFVEKVKWIFIVCWLWFFAFHRWFINHSILIWVSCVVAPNEPSPNRDQDSTQEKWREKIASFISVVKSLSLSSFVMLRWNGIENERINGNNGKREERREGEWHMQEHNWWVDETDGKRGEKKNGKILMFWWTFFRVSVGRRIVPNIHLQPTTKQRLYCDDAILLNTTMIILNVCAIKNEKYESNFMSYKRVEKTIFWNEI